MPAPTAPVHPSSGHSRSDQAFLRRPQTLSQHRRTLSRRSAFGLLTSIMLMLLASSSAPTPLYATYQAQWGFSAITITVIFGVYAVAVLISLLVFGSLSDHVGRRPVLIAGLVMQSAVMALFAFAGDVDVLLLARVLQGIATGLAVGAIGAALVDLHPGHGPVANAAGAMGGTASGALASALFVALLPSPTRLVYLVLLVLFVLQAVGVALMAETSARTPGALAALRPAIAIPSQVRSTLAVAAPSLVAVWALGGFYLSLGPSLAARVAGTHSAILAGAAVFVLAGSGALTVVALRTVRARTLSIAGSTLVVAGVPIVLVAASSRSLALFFIGTAVAGAGFGGGFQGGLRTILALAGPAERAGVISVAYIICYLALGLPAILAGVLVVDSTVLQTAREFGVAVIVLAGLTAGGMTLGAVRARTHRPAACTATR
ncbi:MAG TPA: MFS transporter [Solirubrobacteraceae bacterium]|nr:MFS transporter [Solirubrobacteraceae bacterium]